MPTKGYDLFYTEPDEVESMYCKVCGSPCDVERSLHGPTGWASAMAQRGIWHDRFICPHAGKEWHARALEIFMQKEETASKRVAALMRQDLEEILRENGISGLAAEGE